MQKINEWEYFSRLQHYTDLYRNFGVKLTKRNTKNLSESQKNSILNLILNPLCSIANSIYLYGLYAEDSLSKLEDVSFEKKRGKLKINDTTLNNYLYLLDNSLNDCQRGTLLIEIPFLDQTITSL